MSHSGPWAKANRGEEEIPKTVLSFSHRLVLLYFPHLQGPSLFFCPHPPGAQSALLLQPFFPVMVGQPFMLLLEVTGTTSFKLLP